MPCGRGSSRQRPHDTACSSRAPKVAREHPGPGRPIQLEPEDGRQVEGAHHHDRCTDGAERSPQHCADAGRGSHDRRVPPPHAAAAGRCVLGCLRDTIPRLTRSALHRCLKRHGISRLPESEDKTSRRGRFAETAIGYVHIDICELRLAAGKLHMFLAIDRVSKFTYVEFHEHANTTTGPAFLRNVVVAFPYRIRIVLTDNGTPFADLPKNRSGPTARLRGHMFDRVCREHGIEHRLTKPYHPWTNGQAERMNRTIKDATVKAFHYESLESLKDHVLAFVAAYNFAKHLKALRWRTPFEAIQDAWTNDPSPFKINPHQLIPRPNT